MMTIRNILVIGLMIKSKAKEYSDKKVKLFIKVNGLILRDTVEENLYMEMEVNTMVIFTMIKSMDLVYL